MLITIDNSSMLLESIRTSANRQSRTTGISTQFLQVIVNAIEGSSCVQLIVNIVSHCSGEALFSLHKRNSKRYRTATGTLSRFPVDAS